MESYDTSNSSVELSKFKNRGVLRLILIFSLVLTLGGLFELFRLTPFDILVASRISMLLIFIYLTNSIFLLVALAAMGKPRAMDKKGLFTKGVQLLGKLGTWNLVPTCLILSFTPAMGFWSSYPQFDFPLVRLSLIWIGTLWGCVFLHAWMSSSSISPLYSWEKSLLVTTLLATFIYKSTTFAVEIRAYPFSLYWSEASRFYYASLFFSERIYGLSTSPTVLHSSRYLMQAIPFLIPTAPIWLHRAWQTLLWIGITLITSACFANRLKVKTAWTRAAFILWCFAFLMIGPVYYHLQIPIILLMAFFRNSDNKSNKAGIRGTILPLVAASLWAGISRVNWFPVPAFFASLLYFLETPIASISNLHRVEHQRYQMRIPWQNVVRYFLRPVLWLIIGVSSALVAQAGYIYFSKNAVSHFSTSFFSDLLWYRLLPNATYPFGILLGTMLVSLPLGLLIWLHAPRLGHAERGYHFYFRIRLFAQAVILLALFTEGLIVSVKIGGGSNLHNMDAFFIALMTVTSYVVFHRIQSEPLNGSPHFDPSDSQSSSSGQKELTSSPRAARFPQLEKAALTLAIAIPMLLTLLSPPPARPLHTQAEVQETLTILARATNDAQRRGGELLFISERQLLTFGLIPGISLFPEYEKIFLMEMAMANQRDYLEKFYADLAEKRFSLIITEPLFIQLKSPYTAFAEENNAWVERVAMPILCHYEIKRTIPTFNIQLLVPLQKPRPCS